MRNIIRYILIILGVICYVNTAYATIKPAGTTNTTIISDDKGHITVNIAPIEGKNKIGDISYNAYTDFNVLKPGVTLDNQAVDARTIINEVISNNTSIIQGDINVSGPRAHIIIANPNGIVVDGGRFINTGGVALTTGRVALEDISVTPITTQQNAIIETSEGTLTIEGAGLSGIFTNLELIAKQVFIDGKIENEQPLSGANIRISAGETYTTFDSSISTVDMSNIWAFIEAREPQATCPDAICVTITPAGSISSNNIQIALTDAGAGVNNAGIITAHNNNIQLTIDGDITLDGTLTAASHITIETNGKLALASETAAITAEQGGVLVQAQQAIENNGGVIAGNARIDALEDISLGAVTLTTEGSITQQSVSRDGRAAIYGQNDDVYIKANQAIHNRSANIIANGNIVLIAEEGEVNNDLVKRILPNEGIVEQYKRKGESVLFRSQTIRGQQVAYGELLIDTDAPVISAAGDITIEATQLHNRGGDVFSQAGDIAITAEHLTNTLEFTGAAFKEIRCAWLCSHKTGSTIQSYGGNIQAANNINITVEEQLFNHGGVIQSVSGDLSITGAQQISAISKAITEIINIDRGAFHDNYARLLRYDQGGSFIANMGRLEISSLQPILLDGGEILAYEQSIEPNITVIREKQTKPNAISANAIGIGGEVL